MPHLSLNVWSDIACPWCYVGKRRLEAALADFEHADSVRLRWCSFELDPTAPRVREPEPYADRLARKYGTSHADAEGMIARMTHTGAEHGLELRFDRIRPGNTFDAHRLLHLAHEHGLQDPLKERFFRGYLTDGEAIGETEVLQRLAVDVGLDANEVGEVLDGERFAEDVRADESEAQALGIGGVPFFLFGGRLAASGAQPPETLVGALRQAWADAR